MKITGVKKAVKDYREFTKGGAMASCTLWHHAH